MISVGSMVECMDDRFPPQVYDWGGDLPRRGRRYTVRRIMNARDGNTGEMGLAYVLNELNNPLPNGRQLGFSTWRFREYLEEYAESDALSERQGVTACLAVSV